MTRCRSRRLRAGVVLAVVLFVASACGSGARPPSPDIAPLGRLGRWNGATFVAVTPASVSSGHLYVLVHGWAAGFKTAVDRYPGPGPLLAWYPEAVTANGEQFLSMWLAPMAAALSRLDPGAAVVAFSWLDQSATDDNPLAARTSESHTVRNGERLGEALDQLIAPGFAANGGLVHVLGHSHGAKVATIGSLALRPPPAQLTLLDSVDTVVPLLVGANNHLVHYLQRLPVGRRPGATFVDNYFSEMGRAYGNEPGLGEVADVSLPPDQYPRIHFADRHMYPPHWYIAAAEQPSAGVGPMWSPLLGNRYQKVAPYHVRAYPRDVARQLDLEVAGRPPPPDTTSFLKHWSRQLVAAALVLVLSVALLVVAVNGWRRWRQRRRAARLVRQANGPSVSSPPP